MARSEGLDRRGRSAPGEHESRQPTRESRRCVFVFAGLGKDLISIPKTRTEQAKRTPANEIEFSSADQPSIRTSSPKEIHLPVTPSQTGGESNTPLEQLAVTVSCSPLGCVPRILEVLGRRAYI